RTRPLGSTRHFHRRIRRSLPFLLQRSAVDHHSPAENRNGAAICAIAIRASGRRQAAKCAGPRRVDRAAIHGAAAQHGGEVTLLALRGITKAFGGSGVLFGVDFDVRAGEVHALAGENGAGKSTLMNIVSGVTPPDAGEILWEGRP